MSRSRRPARIVSPGKIISNELEARGWTQRDLADVMGRPYQAINEIIKGSKQITPDTARELAKAFGTSMDFWMNLETNYRLFLAEQEDKERKIERRSRIYSTVPVRELVKRGWIKGSEDTAELEDQVCNFLGVSTIEETPVASASLRISESRGPENSAKIAWIKRVEQLAREQPVGNFNQEQLWQQHSKITDLARNVEDVAKLPNVFREFGVHFLVVPHLPHTYLDGAALFVGQHPVIAVTLRYDRIDYFWFTVLHEWAHIVLGHPAHTDTLFDDYEESGSESSQHVELEANELARRTLLDQQALDQFVARVRPYFSKTEIESFAAEQKRHPGIVLGQLQYRQVVEYRHLRSMLLKVGPYLQGWLDRPVPTELSV